MFLPLSSLTSCVLYIEEFHNAPQTYTHNKSQSIIIITEPIIMGIQKAIVGWFAQFNRYRFSLYELTIA